jgi:hypothetical protein
LKVDQQTDGVQEPSAILEKVPEEFQAIKEEVQDQLGHEGRKKEGGPKGGETITEKDGHREPFGQAQGT